jgi:hypothetical protein
MTDRRRYGVIETRFQRQGELAFYWLTIRGEVWACVEWSADRRRWCIQDASGRCLAHCDAVHGQDVDAATAVRLARRMILDGRMPTPEEAQEQLEARLEQDRVQEMVKSKRRTKRKSKKKAELGVPMEILAERMSILEPVRRK